VNKQHRQSFIEAKAQDIFMRVCLSSWHLLMASFLILALGLFGPSGYKNEVLMDGVAAFICFPFITSLYLFHHYAYNETEVMKTYRDDKLKHDG